MSPKHEGGGKYRHNDPSTSVEGSRDVDDAGRKAQIMTMLSLFGPSTSFEVADLLKVPVQNISSMFSDLERTGQIIVIGTKRSPETNRQRQVYQAT